MGIRDFYHKFLKRQKNVQLKTIFDKIDSFSDIEKMFDDLRAIVDWVRNDSLSTRNIFHSNIQRERLLFLIEYLESHPEDAKKFSTMTTTLIRQSEPIGLFLTTGIQEHQGFIKELIDRTIGRLIPKNISREQLENLFRLYFRDENDLFAWLHFTQEQQLKLSLMIWPTTEPNDIFVQKFRGAIERAINVLMARTLGIISDRDLRARLPSGVSRQLPFFKLQRYFISRMDQAQPFMSAELTEVIALCREEIQGVYATLELQGVSIDLVYKLESLHFILDRIRLLSSTHDHCGQTVMDRKLIFTLLHKLAEVHVQQNRLRQFLGQNLNMLAKKIVERNSLTGEHYITRTSPEYYDMLASAAGGGLITSLTSLVKVLIQQMRAPLFIEGALTGLNYAASFIIIQLSHFTLATKTPAVTATTLASRLNNIQDENSTKAFVDEVVAIHRSAFIAVVGNLGLVIPGCILIDIICYQWSGKHLLSSQYAIKGFEAHNPITSLTIIYAVFTGAILWAASVMGAWFENWCVYRQQFQVMSRSRRLLNLFGLKRLQKLVDFAQQNIAGLSTNVFLGFMLSFFSIWGMFFGLPLDVRHVTLATGSLTYCLMAIENIGDHLPLILGSAVGILCIGILNFAVSFALSLFVATRARNIRLSQFPYLFDLIFQRYKKNWITFYIPTKQLLSSETK